PARGMEQARWGQFVDSIKALCYYAVGNSGLGGEAYELATGAYVPNQRRKSLGQNGQGEAGNERKPASQGPDHAYHPQDRTDGRSESATEDEGRPAHETGWRG